MIPGMVLAEIVLAGVGATYILGLPMGELEAEPILFNMTFEALVFSLALLLPVAVFFGPILDWPGFGAGADRPVGNARPEHRRWLVIGCWVGIAACVIGLVAFSLFSAEVVAGQPGVLAETMPYIFRPVFALTTAGAWRCLSRR
jgi:hypothetical protein